MLEANRVMPPISREDMRVFTDGLSYLFVHAPLTQRELEIVYLHVIRGYKYREIGAQLGIRAGTVETYFGHASRKIKAYEYDRVQAESTYGTLYRVVLMMYARVMTERGLWADSPILGKGVKSSQS